MVPTTVHFLDSVHLPALPGQGFNQEHRKLRTRQKKNLQQGKIFCARIETPHKGVGLVGTPTPFPLFSDLK